MVGLQKLIKDDVIRSFTFFDKSKVTFFGIFRHDGAGKPPDTQSKVQYAGYWAFDPTDDSAYADQVKTHPLTANAA